MRKQLADTDSIYCSSVTNSHQSSIFIAQTDSNEACSVFGNNYQTNMDVVIVLSKDNLLLNLLSHYLGGVEYYERGTTTKWKLNRGWLLDKSAAVTKVFKGKTGRFHASLNKETSRTYLKGITSLKSEMGGDKLDLRDYLFSGDVIELVRQKDGSILLSIQGCGGEFKFGSVELLKEFEDWLTNVHKKPDGKPLGATAIGSYIRALDVSTKPNPDGSPASNHGKVVWHNIYQHLHGSPAPKGVFQIDSLAEFDTMFGPLKLAVNKGDEPPNVISQHFTEIQQWIAGQTGGAFLPPALDLYGKFLEWREGQQKGKDEPLPVLPAVDRLSIALKVFAEKRYEAEWQDKTRKDGYQNIYDMAGMTPEQIAAGSLDDFYNDFLLKIWAFKNGGSRRYGQLDEAGRKAYRQFVVDLKTQLKSFDSYFPPDPKCPDGMGVGVLTELMMRFWPKSCCNYNASLIHEALVTLHMAEGDFVWPKTPSVYQDFMGKCATILLKMEQMKLPRRSDPGNDEPPDYITVNEFLWFVHEYKELIKEEVMSKAMKNDKPTKYDEGKRKKLAFDPNSKDAELLLRLLAALRAKPFAILAGHSGTGKSRYVKKLAYMTCNMDELRNEKQLPGNYLLLQVKPNWHDSTELLGFRNAMDGDRYQKTKLIEFLFRAYQFKDTPFFLCLDEMNLAPVEQYFAEFLSSMESAEPVPLNDITVKDDNLFDLGCEWKAAYDYLAANGFSIPKNLFIVGTVNMDETTNQFSRKVLDRAFTIEMTDVDFKNYGHVTQPSYADTIEEEKIQALLNGEKFVDKLDAEDVAEGAPLVKVQKALEPTAFAVAYRFANEYTLLKRAIACFDKDSTMKLDALDQAVLMKILPRVAGEKDYIEKVYGKNDNEGLRKALEGKSVSLKKIAEIMKRANDMNAQYITFWP